VLYSTVNVIGMCPSSTTVATYHGMFMLEWRYSLLCLIDMMMRDDGCLHDSDVSIMVAGRRFVAHRVIVASRSSVLAKLLFPVCCIPFHNSCNQSLTVILYLCQMHRWGDQQANGDIPSTITLHDIDPTIFQVVLQSIYSDDASVSRTNVAHLLEAAIYCREPQFTAPTPSSPTGLFPCMMMPLVLTDKLTSLQSQCVKYINKRFHDMISSGAFVHLSREVFGGMLMRHDLGLSEMALFKLMLRWGEHHLQRKQIPNNKANMRYEYTY
jgi:hypothetical protein